MCLIIRRILLYLMIGVIIGKTPYLMTYRKKYMSKYDNLWKYAAESRSDKIKLTYEEIEEISGVPIDHSFLKYKNELSDYGYVVSKISMKQKTVSFEKIK